MSAVELKIKLHFQVCKLHFTFYIDLEIKQTYDLVVVHYRGTDLITVPSMPFLVPLHVITAAL